MKYNTMGKARDLLSDDLELLQREIHDFCGGGIARREAIPKIVDDYLLYVAKTGNIVFPWQQTRQLFRWKLQESIASFSAEPMQMEDTVFERFDLFRSAPFTIQRLSELITDPKKHYNVKEKFLFALEKAVFVVSTVEPSSPEEEEVTEDTNPNPAPLSIHSEPTHIADVLPTSEPEPIEIESPPISITPETVTVVEPEPTEIEDPNQTPVAESEQTIVLPTPLVVASESSQEPVVDRDDVYDQITKAESVEEIGDGDAQIALAQEEVKSDAAN